MALYRPSPVLVRNRDPNMMPLNDYSALRRAGPGNACGRMMSQKGGRLR